MDTKEDRISLHDDYCKHMAAVVYNVTQANSGEPGNSKVVASEPTIEQSDDDINLRLQSMDKEELLLVRNC
ncbi:MAG: hypothetical protein AB1420_17775 [Bacillota bacterium]